MGKVMQCENCTCTHFEILVDEDGFTEGYKCTSCSEIEYVD